MATVQHKLSDLEQAQQEGISLAWLEQLKSMVSGTPGDDETENSPNLTSQARRSPTCTSL